MVARLWALTAALTLTASSARASDIPLAPSDRVSDPSGILTTADRRELVGLIAALDRDTDAELGVLILDRIDGDDFEGYAVEVFNAWGIGRAGANNGVLLLLLVSQRHVRITPGTGFRSLLDEDTAGRLLDTSVVPRLRQTKHAAAVLEGAREISKLIRQHLGAKPDPGPPYPSVKAFGGGASNDPLRRVTRAWRQGGVKEIAGSFSLFAAIVAAAYFLRRKCPKCRTYLRSRSRTLVSATYTSSGRGERRLDCPRCGFRDTEFYTIARRTRSTSSSSSRSSFSSGGSRSGGSFGGGRSSGGGAGRSW
ncbi:MAG: TPM domain-containing protein [Deltaproteobacteria bacterium]|nr:TPM domain-containing protein [Deltaproteobacteria bacterium]